MSTPLVVAVAVGFGSSQFIANFKWAYGLPIAVFTVIAAGCDAAARHFSPVVPFHQYE